MMMKPVILAGGEGTRLKIDKPKPLFQLDDGSTMVEHVISAVQGDRGCLPPLIVVGYGKELVMDHLGPNQRYAIQTDLTGTATAVKAALPLLGNEPVLVLYSDNPYISTASVKRMREAFEAEGPTLSMFSATLGDYKGTRSLFQAFGRVRRDGGRVVGVVENKNATLLERAILEVTPGGMCFDAAWLKMTLPEVKKHPHSGEYTLTQLVEMAVSDGQKVTTVPIPEAEAYGINSLEDYELLRRG